MDQMMMINSIEAQSVVDGPGNRTTIFMQGCAIHCPGCQSPQLQTLESGHLVSVSELAATLLFLTEKTNNITISGGEPFGQPKALAYLVRELANMNRHIIVYSGYTWEQLNSGLSGKWIWVREVLDRIHVLVDGPFIKQQDHDFLNWRGSANQRPIDVPASLKAGYVITLDWSQPELVLDNTGNLTMPVGLSEGFAEIGSARPSRMCGQVS